MNTAQGNGGGTGFNAPLALPGSTFTIPSINGQWNRSNMFLLDGIVNEFFFGSSYAILPIVDAVQEFKVQSHNDKAEYGGVFGGVINVVSKSGGNNLHGSAWEFLRNDFFDARNPFADAARSGPTPFRQNMFGRHDRRSRYGFPKSTREETEPGSTSPTKAGDTAAPNSSFTTCRPTPNAQAISQMRFCASPYMTRRQPLCRSHQPAALPAPAICGQHHSSRAYQSDDRAIHRNVL